MCEWAIVVGTLVGILVGGVGYGVGTLVGTPVGNLTKRADRFFITNTFPSQTIKCDNPTWVVMIHTANLTKTLQYHVKSPPITTKHSNVIADSSQYAVPSKYSLFYGIFKNKQFYFLEILTEKAIDNANGCVFE